MENKTLYVKNILHKKSIGNFIDTDILLFLLNFAALRNSIVCKYETNILFSSRHFCHTRFEFL